MIINKNIISYFNTENAFYYAFPNLQHKNEGSLISYILANG